jgi:hypothetical protein
VLKEAHKRQPHRPQPWTHQPKEKKQTVSNNNVKS